MKKCYVIYNYNSGKSKSSKYIDKIYKILEKHGYESTIIYTKYPKHAEEIIYEIDEADLVISAGGDGTFSEVMTGNLRREKPLLIGNLPVGTTNDVGFMYGYKKNILKNLELLLNGVVKEIDVCMINEKVFTYVAGFGNFINIAYDTPRKLKKKYGKFAYIIYGLSAVRDNLKTFDVTYEIDNVSYSGKYSLIFVTNSNRVAGVNNIYDDVKLNDGKFEVVFCNLNSKADLVKGFLQFGIKKVNQIPGFTYHKTTNLSIKIDNKQETSWCLDGDKLDDNQLVSNFDIIKDIKLLIPKKNEKKLFMDIDEDL